MLGAAGCLAPELLTTLGVADTSVMPNCARRAGVRPWARASLPFDVVARDRGQHGHLLR